MPDSLIGIVFLLAGVGPGYVFLRVAERREPRAERSALLEAAELVVVGAATTSVSGLLNILLAEASGLVDITALAIEPRRYFAASPVAVVFFSLAILAVSFVLAWGSARLSLRGKAPTIFPNLSVWRAVAGEVEDQGRNPMAAVELKDGRIVSGYLFAYTVDPESENREIGLTAPIFAGNRGKPLTGVNSEYVIIPSEQITYLSISGD